MTDIFDRKKRSEIMSRVRGRDTAPEMIVRKIAPRPRVPVSPPPPGSSWLPRSPVSEVPGRDHGSRVLLAPASRLQVCLQPEDPRPVLGGQVRGQCGSGPAQ